MSNELSFISKCWKCLGREEVRDDLKPYLLSSIGSNFDLLPYVRAWLDIDRYLEVYNLLHNYYQDMSTDINPIMIGVICNQAERLSVSNLYYLYKESEVWNIPHSLLLNHMMPDTSVDLIGFYIWLSRYKKTGASASAILREMWKPFDMGIDDFDIVEELNKQGLYCISKRSRRSMLRWTDPSMPERILSIGEALITTYRMRQLTQSIRSLPFYRYRFLPE